MIKELREKLRRLIGQPVKIFTDDGRIHRGIVLDVDEDTVEIIDKCNRLFLIELFHIDAIEEPQMDLRPCRCEREDEDEDEDDECGCGRARVCMEDDDFEDEEFEGKRRNRY